MRCSLELVLHANYLKVDNEEENDVKLTKEKVVILLLAIFYY